MAPVRTPLAFSLAASAALVASVAADSVQATSITRASPHDPRRGCAAILRLIDNLNAGRMEDEDEMLGPNFYSDGLGKVERDEEPAFLHAMRHNEGRPDDGPIRLYHADRIHAGRDRPIYLVVLERRVWRETRLEQDDMLNVVEIRDPRHYYDTSYWLASFWSNQIHSFREAGDLYPMMDESIELANCTSL